MRPAPQRQATKTLQLDHCIKLANHLPAQGKVWMGGRAVEGTGLENRRGSDVSVGSNPTPSASAVCLGAGTHSTRLEYAKGDWAHTTIDPVHVCTRRVSRCLHVYCRN